MKKHGVFMVECFDHPRGYYYDVFCHGKWLGSYDYHSDASDELSRNE